MKRAIVIISVFGFLAAVAALRLPSVDDPDPGVSPAASPDEVCTWTPGDLHIRRPRAAGKASDFESSVLGALSLAELADVATARQLSYVAVIDAEGVSSITDPAFGAAGIEWLIGTERRFNDGDLAIYGPSLAFVEPPPTLLGARSFAESIHRIDGVAQLARPEAGRWTPAEIEKIGPDTVEVWRGGPFPYATPRLHKNSTEAIALYDDILDRGLHVAAVGGSDTASRAYSDVAGPGQPTTWACVDGAGPPALTDAIRRGRTTISHEVPAATSPLLALAGDQDGDGIFEEQMGDAVPAGTMLRVSVRDAPAARVRLITDGGRLLEENIVDSFDFGVTLRAPEGASWVRAEVYLDESLTSPAQRTCSDPALLESDVGEPVRYCGGRIPMLAVSSPIYSQAR